MFSFLLSFRKPLEDDPDERPDGDVIAIPRDFFGLIFGRIPRLHRGSK